MAKSRKKGLGAPTTTMVKLASISLLLCFASAQVSAFIAPSPTTFVGRTTVCVSESAEGAQGEEEVPEGLKALLETPEIMELLQSEKMQEAMQLVMAGKQDELQEKVKEDPEFQEIVQKLGDIMGGAQPGFN